jgi:hypothetical protein
MRKILSLSGRKLRADKKEPTVNEMGMTSVLMMKPGLYTGGVGKNVIDKRRAKSKMAKQSRKVNRGR